MRSNLLRFILLLLVGTFILLPQREVQAATFAQDQKLTAGDFTGDTPRMLPDNEFGQSVATNGTWMVVGAPRSSNSPGEVHIYENVSGTWTLRRVRIPLTNVQNGQRYGYDVAINEAGTFILVGAPASTGSQGRVYVLERDAGGTGNWGQTRELINPLAAPNARFGHSVAISGTLAIVGAPGNNEAYVINANTNSLIATSTHAQANVDHGISVDISGDYAIVGAPRAVTATGQRAGQAYLLFRNQGGSNVWGVQHTLNAPAGTVDDYFGFAVGIFDTGSGSRSIVGAPLLDNGAFANVGATYLYGNGTLVNSFVGAAVASNVNHYRGYSVSIDGDGALFGVPGLDSPSLNNGSVSGVGFNGTSWSQTLTLSTQADTFVHDNFGWSVDVFGTIGVAGARSDVEPDFSAGRPMRAGSIQLYSRSGVNWTPGAEITPIIDLPDTATNRVMGTSVDFTSTWLAVGVPESFPGSDRGVVYLYQNISGVWTPHSRLTALYGQPGNGFGYSVALSGTRLVVGAPYSTSFIGNNANAGMVYLFEFDGTNWVQRVERRSPNEVVNGYFGSSVDFNGDVIVVGAPGEASEQGFAYAYRDLSLLTSPIILTGTDPGDQFGTSVSVYDPAPGTPNDESIAVGSPFRSTGEAYVFSGATFSTINTIPSPTPVAGARFGWSVSLFDGRLAVGAPTGNFTGAPRGEVFVFSGPSFTTTSTLIGASSNQFGFSVSMDAGTLIVGAPRTATSRGSAFVFSRSAEVWTEEGVLTPGDGVADDRFGTSVALGSGLFLVGSPQHDANSISNSGAAYAYSLAPEVLVSETTLTVSETGETTDTFVVSLNQAPSANVTIQLTYDSAQIRVNTGSGLGTSPQTVTLTPANWNTGVTVTVQAIDDFIDETDPHSVILTTATTVSSQSRFTNLPVADVTVDISDNDTAGITITQSGGNNAVTEAGTTDTYTIVLDSQPISTVNVAITFPASDLTLNGDTDGTFNTTFTAGNWNTAQTLTIAAVNDRALEGDHSGTLVHAFTSGDPNYNGATARVDGTTNTNTLTVNITDNETAVVEWNPTSASAAEGANNTPNVRLDITADPTGGTPTLEGTINYTLGLTLGTAEAADLGTLTGALSFTNVSDLATNAITIPHLDDTLVEGPETYTVAITLGSSPTGVTVSGTNFTGTITDGDSATVALSGAATVSEAVGTHNAVVTLTTTGGATLAEDAIIPLNLVDNTAVFSGATGDMFFTGPANTINVTFAAGAGDGATQNAPITINNDRTVERSTLSSTGFNTPENFNVTFGTLPSSVTAGTSTIAVTIDENDFAYITMDPTFVVNDTNDIESNTARTTNVRLRIVATGTGTVQVQDAFSVPVSNTALGNPNDATPGADFTAISTTVNFPALAANDAVQPISVTIINDGIDEFYGALSLFNQNREFFDVGFNDPVVRASYAGVPILVSNAANDDCSGSLGFSGACRSRSTIIILDDDTAGITVTESSGNTAVVEGGAGDSYTVVLNSQPTSNVTLNIDFDETQITVNGDTDGVTSLLFTTSNWNTPQNVTVFAVNDTLVEANPHTTLIDQSVTSTDLVYNAISPADVTVSITDNDTATIVFTTPSSNANENVGTHTVTARLDLVTNGTPGGTLSGALTASVNVTLGTAEAADFSQTTTSISFAAGSTNGATRPINFTIINDQLVEEANETFTLDYTLISGTGTVSGTHVVTIIDNESATVTFSTATSTVSEATSPHLVNAVLTITSNGIGPIRTGDAITIDITDTPGTATAPDYTRVTNSISFASGTASGATRSITNTIVNDSLVEATDETFSLAFGTVTGPSSVTATGTHVVTIDENDSAVVNFVGSSVIVNENVGSFVRNATLLITTDPAGGTLAADLTIPVNYVLAVEAPPTSARADTPDDFILVTTSITFLAGSANNATQPVTITIIDDNIDEFRGGTDREQVDIELNNNNPNFAPNITLTGSNWTLAIDDNDTAGITVNPTTVAVNEDGPTSQDYTVVLNSQPTANVTVNITFDAAQITVDGETDGTYSLTFTSGDWNTPQTITVLAVDDFVTEGPHSTTIVQTAASGDANYNVVNPADVLVNIADNDTPGSQVIQSGGTTELTEANVAATDSYTIRLDSRPTQDVTVNLVFDPAQISLIADGTPFSTSPATFTIVPGDWNVLQTVEVVVIDDNIDEVSPHTTLITQTFTSTDSNYNTGTGGVNPADVTVSIIDNDTAAIQIAPGTVNVSESGTTAPYTIEALTRPTANVTVTLTFNSAQIRVNGQVSPVVVTLTPVDFTETVTVSAVDDSLDETDPHTELITHAIASSDPFYDALPDGAQVTVNITDNDTAGITITQTDSTTNVTEGSATPDTYTVVLNSQPTANVTVNLTFNPAQVRVNGDTDGNLSLTFTTSDWNTAQTLNVLAFDDAIDETNPHTSPITHAAVSTDLLYNAGGATFTPNNTVTVNITDNDVATVVITETSGTANDNNITVTEGGAGSSFNVVLNSEPTANVQVSMTFNDTQILAGSPTPGLAPLLLTFTPSNWNTPQTVNVSAVDDNVFQNIGTSNISITSGSADPFYVSAPIQPASPVVVNIVEDDVPALVLNDTDNTPLNLLTDVAVREGFTTDQYRVLLNSQPLGDVTVTLTFDDTQIRLAVDAGAPQVSPVVLTFTTATWNTARTITVSALEDFTLDAGTELITHDISSAGDAFYNALTSVDVTVTITDGITTPPAAFNLVRPSNFIYIPNVTSLTTFQWQDTLSTSPGLTFDFAINRTLPVAQANVVTFTDVTRAADADALTCDGTNCTLTIGVTEQALLTDGTYQWTVTAKSPLGNTNASNQPFTFTIDSSGNLLVNGGFETDADNNNMPDNWRLYRTRTVDDDILTEEIPAGPDSRRVCSGSVFEGSCAFRMGKNGYSNWSQIFVQNIDLPPYGQAGDVLTLTARVRTQNLQNAARMMIVARYSRENRPRTRVQIPAGTSAYTEYTVSITLTGQPSRIVARFETGENAGFIFIDDVRLTLAPGSAPRRSEDGQTIPMPQDPPVAPADPTPDANVNGQRNDDLIPMP
ncbi:MAG: hypothetical protein MUF87_01540 [Anaerolineae bacterium]|nr:hypothetical protein [Anaerolineae bacterium]